MKQHKHACAIVIDYFGADKTVRCVNNLVKQDFQTIYVVGNSENDIANRELKEKLGKDHNEAVTRKVQVIINDKNRGFGNTINDTYEHYITDTDCSRLLIVNNDALVKEDLLSELSLSMDTDPHVAITAPLVKDYNGNIERLHYSPTTGILLHQKSLDAFRYYSGCCLLLNIEILSDRIFDRDFFMYGEDVELTWRVLKKGYRIIENTNTYVIHEGGGSSKKGDIFYEYQVTFGHLILAKKLSTNFLQRYMYYFLRGPVLLGRAIVRSFRYRSFTPLHATLLAMTSFAIKNHK